MSLREESLKFFNEQKEEFEKRTSEGIEKYRKGNFKITLKDKNGSLIKNARISVKQKSHEFKFGANIFLLDEFREPEKSVRYREIFKEVFNLATIPFYWYDLEPEQGKVRFSKDSKKIYRRPPIDLCMEYCKENNIEPKLHCLSYPKATPDWACNDDVNIEKQLLEKRCKEIADRYAKDIKQVEVMNEVVLEMPGTYCGGRVPTLYSANDLGEFSFALAEKYFKDNTLIINEDTIDWWDNYSDRRRYCMLIDRLLCHGARIDEIGYQFHLWGFHKEERARDMARYLLNPRVIYKTLDTYAKFNLPMQITEITVPSGSYDQDDEDLQAEILKNVYTMFFSYENMTSLIYWNLVDGTAHVAKRFLKPGQDYYGDLTLGENVQRGGLLRFDMTEKPAFKMLKRLVKEVWNTKDEKTSKNGVADFRGFYGEYDVEIVVADKVIHREINNKTKSANEFEFVIE